MRTLVIVVLVLSILAGAFYVDNRLVREELAAARQEVKVLQEINAALLALPQARERTDGLLLAEIARSVAELKLIVDAAHYEDMEMQRWLGQENRAESFTMRLSRVREWWLQGQGGGKEE